MTRSERPGFSLVEVIVAMALLVVVSALLATLAVSVGNRGRANELVTKRNAALAQQAGRLSAIPFSEVAALSSGTTQMLIGDFTFYRKLTVTKTTTNSVTTRVMVKVVVAPIASEFSPDSVTIERTRPAAGTPLCTTCTS